MTILSIPCFRRPAALVLIVLFLLIAPSSAAPRRHPGPQDGEGFNNLKLNFGFGKDIALVAVGVGAAVGVGLYLLLRKGPSVTGCTTPDPSGLLLTNESDRRQYALLGDTAGIKPGTRVRVYGRKNAKAGQFLVRKQAKDLGPCKATP